MPARQHTAPFLVSDGKATPLEPILHSDRKVDEDWLQELLFKHPDLLPVNEIEPIFAGLIPLARELPTEVGPLDLLFVNSEGYLTLVETKLWRNPEARRQVVAQIIDYAQQIARWSYGSLRNALVAALRSPGAIDPLCQRAEAGCKDFNQARFIDQVTRNLNRGRFLLLIVGDGIQEGVEDLVETFHQTPQLGFTFGLIEMGLYRADTMNGGNVIVQPRIVARTVEVTRAVIEIRNPAVKAEDFVVKLPDDQKEEVSSRKGQSRAPITAEVFFERLGQVAKPEIVEGVRDVLAQAAAQGIRIVSHNTGPSFKWFPGNFALGFITVKGECSFGGWLPDQLERAGISKQIAADYDSELAYLPYDKSEVITVDTMVHERDRILAALLKVASNIRKAQEKA